MECLPYFAYGSNLNHDDWRRYCGENRRPDLADSLQVRCVAQLPDYELAFQYRSQTRKGGVLNVRPRRGQFVEGALFDVSKEGRDLLDRKEGVPRYYERFVTTVIDEYGKLTPAFSYRVRTERVVPYARPTKQYLKIVRQGLRQFGLDTDQLKAAAKNQTPDLGLSSFFFYGTLMRNESRYTLLRQFKPTCTLLASIPGRLLDLGACPALVTTESSDERVFGDLVLFQDPEAAIAAADWIEQFHGYDRRDSLYRRTIVDADVGEGRLRPAWAYVFSQGSDDASVIASGDWREHRGTKSSFLRQLISEHSGGDEFGAVRKLAEISPHRFSADSPEAVSEMLPLEAALRRGLVSERRLAQVSGNWTAAG